jgi:hypothetical protein
MLTVLSHLDVSLAFGVGTDFIDPAIYDTGP